MRSRPADLYTWLRLVDPQGPFFSPAVLKLAFPHGFDALDTGRVRALREAYETWCGPDDRRRPDSAIHYGFVRFVLREILGFEDGLVAEGQVLPPGLTVPAPGAPEILRPDLAILTPSGRDDAGRPRLLLHVLPPGADLERPLADARWKVSPATRMAELLQGTRIRLGVVTNGDDWLLVNAKPGDPAGFATFRAWSWLEERETLQAFTSLLGVRRFFGVPDAETPEVLLDRSAESQQDVTEKLGSQVRRAVEVLVQTLDRIDHDGGGRLLADVSEREIYDGALTVMMRLVFLFAAEERGLLRLGEDTWDRNYSATTLGAQLREAADRGGEEILERRIQAWARLLATFRAVHGGIRHEELRLPAYGGTLFNPDRYPFLEGRTKGTAWRTAPAQPLPIDDRTVLHLLESLQILQEPGRAGQPAEARRLSFRALDVEQIGHVYEGLLDHKVRRAEGVVLGLAGKAEPEVPLARLEELRAQGEEPLVSFLAEECDRSENALRRALVYEIPTDDHRFLVACDHDSGLYGRAKPYAGLVRDDTRGRPVVIPDRAAYVTRASDRRSTGTHYTPRSLTEPIVKHTLDPLVYEGPAEGKPRSEWRLRSARDLLGLRVCDPAMGSGAFLVQTCRYLSEHLVEAWDATEAAHPGQVVITLEGDLSTDHPSERPLPRDPAERLILARRVVADRCLYGVDKNPIAVEMAKLSLWLVTLQKDRAFTFVDHALRCGDSLLGVTFLEQLIRFDLAAKPDAAIPLEPSMGLAPSYGTGAQVWTLAVVLGPALLKATELRRRIESRTVIGIADAEAKGQLLAEAEAALDDVHLAADLLVAAALKSVGEGTRAGDEIRDRFMAMIQVGLDPATPEPERARVKEALRERAMECLGTEPSGLRLRRRPLHWLLEFPEAFAAVDPAQRGFDAIVGNPPFLGGQRISGSLGVEYRSYLVEHVARGQTGSADLCAYFFLRSHGVVGAAGGYAMLATNTLAQGDTREVGLDQIVGDGGTIVRAVPSQPWPGEANLEVAVVWIRRGDWQGVRKLNDLDVKEITAQLTVPSRVQGKPKRLAANAGKSFVGSYVLGMGFVLETEEARDLLSRNPRNRHVVFPYLNGEDLNSRPDQSASRWIINFHDWPLERAESYPDCMAIVREKVKPERDRKNRRARRERWWQFAERASELYATIAGLERVLVFAQTSKTKYPVFVETHRVFDQKLVVIATDGCAAFALLCSHVHHWWVIENGSTLRSDPVYTPTDCFETFPFPVSFAGLDDVGARYDANRRTIMRTRAEGLTKTYNRFHSPSEKSQDITTLRALHVEMDLAVLAAYGWSDLDPSHGVHETRQGVRYTFSEAARQEVLDRLLELNHQRYAEEVAAGLHAAGRRRPRSPRIMNPATTDPEKGLFE